MRILSFTDAHITPKGEFSGPTSNGFTDYLERVCDSFEWVEEVIVEAQPDEVVFQGDLFETTGYVDTMSLSIASDLVGRMSTFCSPYFIVGNHDWHSVNNRSHNLHFLRLGESIRVVDLPTYHQRGSVKILFLPWSKNPDTRYVHEADLVLSHIDIKGSLLNAKRKSEGGFDPRSLSVDVPLILNGHMHHPYKITENVANIGALLSRNFKDKIPDGSVEHFINCYDRGLVLIDTIDEEKDLPEAREGIIPEPWIRTEKFKVYRYPNPHDVPFQVVEITNPNQATRWELRLDAGDVPNHYVRVKCKERYKKLAENIVLLARGSHIQIMPEYVPDVHDDSINETFLPEENFKNYVDEVLIFDEEGDRKRILAKGLDYIAAAKKEFRHTLPIEFLKFEACNFQSLGHVAIDLSKHGLTYVEGINRDEPAYSNGAGKSTVPEAIFWCLTGRSLRGYTGDDVIHWNESSCFVRITMNVGGREYLVSRYRNDPIHRNDSVLHIRTIGEGDQEGVWNDISCRRKTETNAKIAEIVGRSRDVLQHSIFLTADLQTRFTALSYPDRVRLIEQITDSQIYGDILKQILNDQTQFYNAKYRYDTEKRTLEESMESLNDRLAEVNGSISEVSRDGDDKIRDRKRKLATQIENRDQLSILIAELDAEIALKRRTEDLEKSISEANDKYEHISKRAARSDADLSSLRSSIKKYKERIADGKCTTCGQPIEGSPLLQELADAEANLPELIETRNVINAEVSEIIAVRNELSVLWNDNRKEIKDLEDKRSNYLKHLDTVEQEMALLKEDIRASRKELESLKSAREELKKQQSNLYDRLKENEQNRIAVGRDVYAVDWLSEAFSTKGIRARMLSSVTVPFLNERIAIYSDILGMPCFLSTERELKSGDVEDQIEVMLPSPRTYKGCSRGEKRKVDLAIQCALNDLAVATGGSHVNLLICDEVIDPLDDLGVSNFVEVLLNKDESSILLMAHRPFLDTILPSKLVLAKQDGVTRLE